MRQALTLTEMAEAGRLTPWCQVHQVNGSPDAAIIPDYRLGVVHGSNGESLVVCSGTDDRGVLRRTAYAGSPEDVESRALHYLAWGSGGVEWLVCGSSRRSDRWRRRRVIREVKQLLNPRGPLGLRIARADPSRPHVICFLCPSLDQDDTRSRVPDHWTTTEQGYISPTGEVELIRSQLGNVLEHGGL
jgi:hypothetical protein